MEAMHQHAQGEHAGHAGQYSRLLGMSVLSFAAMYALMYAMVDVPANVYTNINQFYMAGLMVAPMVVIELALMWRMYANKRANVVILAGALVLLLLCWTGIRQQVMVSDRQFLESMIPHHGAAVLMCKKADLRSAATQQLCARIVASQQAEIEEMKALLEAADTSP